MKEEIYHFNQKSENKELINLSICGITFPDKSYRILRSGSRTSCIEYIEEGTGYVNVGGDIFYPSEGDSYFLEEGRDHHYYSDKSRPWKKYFINFSGKLARSLTEGYGLSNISHFEGLYIKNELTEIIDLAKNSESDHTEEVIAILNRIFIKMHAHAVHGVRDKSIDAEEKMREFLNSKITERFCIEELCEHVARSESQTIRIFKKAYGITPYAYVLDKKISLAKKLLRDTNLSVREIADKLSFSDEYYFSNLFKKKTGSYPREYRRSK